MTLADDPRGFQRLWPGRKPLLGMIHLMPLPGSPRWGGSMAEVVDRALDEVRVLTAGGMDGVIVENFFDAPFFASQVPPETIAAMARVVAAVTNEGSVPVGVNVLRNDARAALGIAAACGARFIRVNVHTGLMWTDQGAVEGRAAETLRARASFGPDVAILADVLVKHATPPPGLTAEAAAADTWSRGLADALVVSGAATGAATAPERIDQVRAGAPDAPVLVGSGVSAETVSDLLRSADGVIVGTSLNRDGQPGRGLDPSRVAALVEAAERPAS